MSRCEESREMWPKWVLDTSSEFHYTPDLYLLHDIIPFQQTQQVILTNGQAVPIIGHGSVGVVGFQFSGAHYVLVQGLPHNTISASALCNSGYAVRIVSGACYVKNDDDGRVVGEGRLRNGVYVFDYLIIAQQDNNHRDDHLGSIGRVTSWLCWRFGLLRTSLWGSRPRDNNAPTNDDEDEHIQRSSKTTTTTAMQPDMYGLSRFASGYYGSDCTHHIALSTSTNEQRSNPFLVDSGAYFHMTWDRSVLKPYDARLKIKPPTKFIYGVLGSNLEVKDVGYISYPGQVRLDGVLFVPKAAANLVSTSQLLAQYPELEVVFRAGSGVTFKEPSFRRGRTRKIGEGRNEGSLFVLETFLPGQQFIDNLMWSVEESSETSDSSQSVE